MKNIKFREMVNTADYQVVEEAKSILKNCTVLPNSL
jgi:hypothetical protein